MPSSTRLSYDTARTPAIFSHFSLLPQHFIPLQREGESPPPSILGRNQTNKGAPPKLYCSTRKAILLYLRSYIGLTPEQYRCAHHTNKQDKHPYSGRTPPPSLPAFPTHRLQSASTARPCHNCREEGFISRARIIYISRSVAPTLAPGHPSSSAHSAHTQHTTRESAQKGCRFHQEKVTLQSNSHYLSNY